MVVPRVFDLGHWTVDLGPAGPRGRRVSRPALHPRPVCWERDGVRAAFDSVVSRPGVSPKSRVQSPKSGWWCPGSSTLDIGLWTLDLPAPRGRRVSRPDLGFSFGGPATLDSGPWTHKVAEPATFLRPVAPDTSFWTPSPSPLGEGRVRAALNSSAPAGAHPSPRSAIQSVRLRLWTRLRRIFDLGL
jgi:hypothetical protein